MTEDPGALDSPRGTPPRALAWTALAVCVAGVVMVLLGAWRVGISTDEPVHVLRYANLQQHGWYLLDDDFDGDEPGSWVTDQYVYGPVFTQVMHAVNRVVGLDPPGALGTTVEAYATRHLVVGVCGLLGALATAAIGRRLLGSWAWGLVAAATLMAIPMWPGLSMFDIKDVPPAAGYTFVTLGLIELLRGREPKRRQALWCLGLLVTGLVLSIGNRPGLWPGLAASFGLAGLIALRRSGRPRRLFHPLVLMAVACLVAYAVLWIAYPAFFSRPGAWLMDSVLNSADYVGRPSGPTGGSWAYLPSHVLLLVPSLLLIVGALGCVTGLPRRVPELTPVVAGWLLVSTQALLLPFLAVVGQSLLYDGLRQVLFACPAVAVLLVFGWRKVSTDLGRDPGVARRMLPLVWSAALLVPVAVQIQLFPFAYSYAVPYATSLGAELENDYWRVSYRELLPQVPSGEFVVCYPDLSDDGQSLRTLPATGRPLAESSADCRTHPASTITPFDLAASDPDRFTVDSTFLAIYNRGQLPGSNCDELGTVERRLYLETLVMSRVARCDLVLSPYPDEGALFGPDGSGAEYLLGGWTSHLKEPGVRLVEPFGNLGFALPESWAKAALRIRVEGSATGVPVLRVNNEPVSVEPVAGGWVAEVPADVVSAMGEGRLVVTVGPATPGGDFSLERVGVEPA